MNDKRGCPECGTSLPVDAPQGLCPVCLMKAAVLASEAQPPRAAERPRVSDPPSFSEFKRMMVDMGIVDTEELERIAADEFIEVSRLARALVRAGKLTPYQSAAIVQGKARGLLIGAYLVLDRVGQGGMGVVFKARHRKTGRIVALKMLPPSFGRDREVVLRFRREFEVATRLSHPNIVSAIDASEDRGVQFLTMEYIEGHNLDELVDAVGPLPIKLALHCAIQAASGLEAAHAQGIVHRDIKPGNLMLDASGMVRLLDLGLARVVEATTPFGKSSDESGSDPRTQLHNLTQSGVYMGTVDFVAPEQADDPRKADHRADIYSLGCTLYFLLTGHPPFVADSALKRLVAHQERPAPSLRAARPDASEAMELIYLRMMAKKPDDRPQSMSEVIDALDACRTSADESREARAALKRAYAETERRHPAAPREDREPGLKDLVTDVVPPEETNRQRSTQPPPIPGSRRWAIALTITALAVLAIFAIVYTQRPRSETPSRDDPAQARMVGGEPATPRSTPEVPHPPPPPPPNSALALKSSSPLPRLLYEDDFSDVASGWEQSPNTKPFSKGYDRGVYFLNDENNGSWMWDIRDVDAPYTCQVVGRILGSNPESSWALVAPSPESQDRGFQVSINGKGELYLGPPFWVVDRFRNDPRIGPIVHPAIRPGNEFNTLRIKVRSRQVEIFVNDVRVCEPVSFGWDLVPCRLRIALVGGRAGAEFDKVQVRELEVSPGVESNDLATVKDFEAPEPPSGPITVAATGPATYRSLFEAVLRAAPGSRITVQPGVYLEKFITVTRPVEIVGNGDPGAVVIEGNFGIFTLASVGVTLRNLTLRTTRDSAILSLRGEHVLEECDVMGRNNAVSVMGERAKLTMNHCEIHGSSNNGIWVDKHSTLILDDCDVFDNEWEGVIAGGDARCEIHGGQFHKNGRAGVRFLERAGGKVESSEIFDNNLGGVQIEGSGEPLVLGCRINRNKGAGVDVLQGSRGVVEDCDLTNNGSGAFSLGENAVVTRKNNKE